MIIFLRFILLGVRSPAFRRKDEDFRLKAELRLSIDPSISTITPAPYRSRALPRSERRDG